MKVTFANNQCFCCLLKTNVLWKKNFLTCFDKKLDECYWLKKTQLILCNLNFAEPLKAARITKGLNCTSFYKNLKFALFLPE